MSPEVEESASCEEARGEEAKTGLPASVNTKYCRGSTFSGRRIECAAGETSSGSIARSFPLPFEHGSVPYSSRHVLSEHHGKTIICGSLPGLESSGVPCR